MCLGISYLTACILTFHSVFVHNQGIATSPHVFLATVTNVSFGSSSFNLLLEGIKLAREKKGGAHASILHQTYVNLFMGLIPRVAAAFAHYVCGFEDHELAFSVGVITGTIFFWSSTMHSYLSHEMFIKSMFLHLFALLVCCLLIMGVFGDDEWRSAMFASLAFIFVSFFQDSVAKKFNETLDSQDKFFFSSEVCLKMKNRLGNKKTI